MIWIAHNGYVGNAAVAALVEADDEEGARAQAIQALTDEYDRQDAQRVIKIRPLSLPVVCEIDL